MSTSKTYTDQQIRTFSKAIKLEQGTLKAVRAYILGSEEIKNAPLLESILTASIKNPSVYKAIDNGATKHYKSGKHNALAVLRFINANEGKLQALTVSK